MASVKPYQSIPGLKVPRAAFDLSYAKLFNCDFGNLIPVMHDEVVPGDILDIGNEIIVRCQPLLAPVLHEINVSVHYFFVPYRILWDGWETFITGGVGGDDESTIPVVRPGYDVQNPDPTMTQKFSLWDYFGFPLNIQWQGDATDNPPMCFPYRAYNRIWSEWYRDQTLQGEQPDDAFYLLQRNWEKDYFTSALTDQQRGTAPALPIAGLSSAEWANDRFVNGAVGSAAGFSTSAADGRLSVNNVEGAANAAIFFADNEVDLSEATTFDVADIRLAFQIQKWLERNARAGARYTEFLQAHYGVSPTDSRLDRPEYIGGTKQPIIISEVLQTSEEGTTPQGNLAGHGISAQGNRAGRYRVEEFGIIMGLLSIMPRSQYSQGANRQWFRRTKYDFYSPEFANLSEQAIEKGELYYTGVKADDQGIFGYQGRYDEMRTKQDLFCGDMRDTFNYWHCGRIFDSAPALNAAFIRCDYSTINRIFAVTDEPGFIVHINNKITALRPMPIQSEPGSIDHH